MFRYLSAYCKKNYQNDWHVFIGCDEANRVWQEAGVWDIIHDGAASLAMCLLSFLCRFSDNVCNEIAMML